MAMVDFLKEWRKVEEKKAEAEVDHRIALAIEKMKYEADEIASTAAGVPTHTHSSASGYPPTHYTPVGGILMGGSTTTVGIPITGWNPYPVTDHAITVLKVTLGEAAKRGASKEELMEIYVKEFKRILEAIKYENPSAGH